MLAPVNHDLTGFGLRIHPAGTKSFIVNFRAGDGGRKAPNKRVTIGRYGRVTVDQARKLAQNFLGQVAGGADPAYERAMAHAMPTLGNIFETLHDLAALPRPHASAKNENVPGKAAEALRKPMGMILALGEQDGRASYLERLQHVVEDHVVAILVRGQRRIDVLDRRPFPVRAGRHPERCRARTAPCPNGRRRACRRLIRRLESRAKRGTSRHCRPSAC